MKIDKKERLRDRTKRLFKMEPVKCKGQKYETRAVANTQHHANRIFQKHV
tara:strand:+ start:332 stop:481 length:150 start_codon:yes stop_codon:yes gene_type:complete